MLIRESELFVQLIHAYCVDEKRLTQRNELLVYMHVNAMPIEHVIGKHGLHVDRIRVLDPTRRARFVIVHRDSSRKRAEGYEWTPQNSWQRWLFVNTVFSTHRSISNIPHARQWIMETAQQQPGEFCEVHLNPMQLGLGRV